MELATLLADATPTKEKEAITGIVPLTSLVASSLLDLLKTAQDTQDHHNLNPLEKCACNQTGRGAGDTDAGQHERTWKERSVERRIPYR